MAVKKEDEVAKELAWEELTKDRVDKRIGLFRDIYDRMDVDEALYFLEKFTLKNLEDSQPTPNVQNVTLNDPQTFAKKAIAQLSKAEQNIVVKGRKLSEEKATPIEEFSENALIAIDERLTNMGEVELYPTQCERVSIRGRIGARCGIRMGKDGTVIWDVMPWDMRFASYEVAPDGMKWASYRIPKTKEMVHDEHGLDIDEDEVLITDAYDRMYEYIWVGEERKKKMKHGLGYVPVVMSVASGGSTLKTTGRSASEGESIFASVRDLYEQLNICATVLQTMNLMAFKRPMQYESEQGERARLPKKPPYGVGAVTAVEKGGGFKSMPLEDVMNATRMIWSILETRIQRGSFSAADYGNLTFPLSAVAIAKLTGEKDEIFIPRLQALAVFYQNLLKMIIKQFTTMGLKAEFGEEGEKKLWTPAELSGDYKIQFNYTALSPEQNIANYSVAAAAGALVSDKFKRTDIIRLKNPRGMEDEINSEMADDLIPSLRLYKMAKAKLALNLEVEAALIANELGLTLEQLKSGKIGEVGKLEGAGGQDMNSTQHDGKELKKPAKTGKQLIPLLGSEGSVMPKTGKTPEKESAELANRLGVGA